MLAFWATYKIKIITYGVIVLAIAWGFKIWLNKYAARVYKRAEIETIERERKVNEQKWIVRDSEYKKSLSDLTSRLKSFDNIEQTVEQMKRDAAVQRGSADAVYKKTIELIQKEKERTNEIVASIPASQLIGSIRAQSGKLPSSYRRGSTDPVGPTN